MYIRRGRVVRSASVTALAVAVGSALVLSSCAGGVRDAERRSAMGTDERDRLIQEQIDQAWDVVVAEYPDEQRPKVEIVRVVSRNRWSKVVYDCLVDSGLYNIVRGADGGVGWDDVPRDQRPAYLVARFTCSARYPLEPSPDS